MNGIGQPRAVPEFLPTTNGVGIMYNIGQAINLAQP